MLPKIRPIVTLRSFAQSQSQARASENGKKAKSCCVSEVNPASEATLKTLCGGVGVLKPLAKDVKKLKWEFEENEKVWEMKYVPYYPQAAPGRR